jgi:hypothetical protein
MQMHFDPKISQKVEMVDYTTDSLTVKNVGVNL